MKKPTKPKKENLYSRVSVLSKILICCLGFIFAIFLLIAFLSSGHIGTVFFIFVMFAGLVTIIIFFDIGAQKLTPVFIRKSREIKRLFSKNDGLLKNFIIALAILSFFVLPLALNTKVDTEEEMANNTNDSTELKQKTVFEYVMPTNGLNLREQPSLSASILKVLKENTEVEVLQESDGWVKIRTENSEGWAYSEYLGTREKTEDKGSLLEEQKTLGVRCSKSQECISGFCVDDVCCESPCTKEHYHCNELGKCVRPITYTCVYRECSSEISCNNFCKNMGYTRCGGNACWLEDPNYDEIKHLMQYSSANYCQCSDKLRDVKYEEEIPYGQCRSTGSCDLVCSWLGQKCLKAGCSCGGYTYEN